MVRVAVLGATGYTAFELIKILLRHPMAKITALTSRQEGNKHVSEVHPALRRRLDLHLEDLPPAEIAARAARTAVMPPERSGGQAQFIVYEQPAVAESMAPILRSCRAPSWPTGAPLTSATSSRCTT